MNTVISVFELPTYWIREQPNTLTKNLHNYHLNYYCDGNEIIIQNKCSINSIFWVHMCFAPYLEYTFPLSIIINF